MCQVSFIFKRRKCKNRKQEKTRGNEKEKREKKQANKKKEGKHERKKQKRKRRERMYKKVGRMKEKQEEKEGRKREKETFPTSNRIQMRHFVVTTTNRIEKIEPQIHEAAMEFPMQRGVFLLHQSSIPS